MDDFENGGGGEPALPDRPRGVNFKKIRGLRDSNDEKEVKKLAKQVQIFYKKDNHSTHDLMTAFPAEYIAIFCERFKEDIWNNGAKSVTILGNDISQAVYKEVLKWMLDSVKCDGPGGAPVPEYEESDANIFRKYATLILAAEYLQIATRDFAEPIIKKVLFKMSRDKQMSWDEVEFYLESFQGHTDTDEKMREVLTNSIANAWWKGRLKEDENEDEDDYCILSILRAEHSQFDQDLHTWCEKNEERIRGKWAEKDAAKNGGGAIADGFDGGENAAGTAAAGDWDQPASTGVIGDWDAPTATAAVGDWASGGDGWAGGQDAGAALKDPGGWEEGIDSGVEMGNGSQKENVAPVEAAGWDTGALPSAAALGDWDEGDHGGDWAEEVNADKQTQSSW